MAAAVNPAAEPVLTDPEYDRRLRAVFAAHDTDRLLLSSRLLAALRADLLRGGAPAADAAAGDGQRRVAALNAHPRVRAVDAEMADVTRIYDALREDAGWVSCYAGASTQVDYRPEPDKVSHSMRASGEIRAPLRDVAALLNEPDLFPSVFWFVTQVEVLGARGRFKRAADLTFFTPPPMHNRHARLFGFAVDGLDEEDCVLIVSRDLRDADGICPLSDEDEAQRKTVRARVHYSMFELKPVSPGVTKVRLIANSDPNLSFVPMPLVNWGSRFVMRFALRVLEARARNIGVLPHAERLSNPVYAFIDQRLLSYWLSKGYTEADYRSGGHDWEAGSAEFDDSPPDSSRMGFLFSNLPSFSGTGSAWPLARLWSGGRSG